MGSWDWLGVHSAFVVLQPWALGVDVPGPPPLGWYWWKGVPIGAGSLGSYFVSEPSLPIPGHLWCPTPLLYQWCKELGCGHVTTVRLSRAGLGPSFTTDTLIHIHVRTLDGHNFLNPVEKLFNKLTLWSLCQWNTYTEDSEWEMGCVRVAALPTSHLSVLNPHNSNTHPF